MIDNQAAQQGEGGFLDSLRDAAQRRAPESGSVLDQLRSLGVDPASMTRRPDTPLTSGQRADLQLDNALGMVGQFTSDAWAGRLSDIDPYAAVSAIAEAGATKILGETAGAAFGGVVGEIANLVGFSNYARNWVSEQVFGMSSGEALDSAFSAFGMEPPTLFRMAIHGNMSSAAFDDTDMENRLRAVDPKASRAEASAAIGEYDPMSAPGIAKAVSTAASQIGTAIGMSMIPGGQAAGAVTAARSAGVIGRVLAPAKAMLTNPGGKAYLGYMGGRQAIDRGADYRRFFEREQQATNVYNDALDRTGLADILGKHEVPQDSRLEQFGVSVASGLMTASSELIGTGFSVAAGHRIASRLMGRYSGRAIEGGMSAVLREAGKKAFAAGGMEGLEEVVDGYGQALIGGIYDWTEEGGWAWSEQTGEPMSFLKVAQNHAPNLMYDFAIAFMVTAPLGGAGGIASVRRRQNLHDAFTMALLRDRMAQAETGSNPGEADFAAAQIIAESMANPGGDGAATQTVLARLREVMPEIGQVTESQLADPAWVRSFVENFPILAMRLSEMDSLSRMNIEWLTGPASRGRVPGSAARGQFLESLRSEMRTLIPTYMQGWFDRSADEIRQYNTQLQQLGNRTDNEARSLRALARSRIHFIRDVRKRVQQAWLNKETIDQSTFQSWLRLSEASGAVDLGGTADAMENSPHTERTAPDDIKSLLNLARQGDNEASFELARRYETGEGVEQHYYKSQYWLNLPLSRLGDVDAMVWMGKYYEGRIQTYPPTANRPRSIDKARALYRRAYEMGSDEAGGLLAELELRGQPTPAVPRPGRVDAARPAQATQAAPATSAAPQPSVPQESVRKPQAASEGVRTPRAASEGVRTPRAATKAPAASEADPAAATRRAIEGRLRVEREAQAEAAAREADAAAAEADASRAEVERQVQKEAEDDGLRVRFVEAETEVERKIAKGAGKLGRRVQFITIMRDTPREGMRRRRSWSGIRGFVGRDADTIYLVRVPQVAQSDRAATAYYLQTLSHENAHGLIQDADQGTLKKADALLNRELIMEMMAFDMGRGKDAREEVRVHTLTLGLNDAAALDAILLADTPMSQVKARLKLLFSRVKIALTGNERAALLQKLVRDQVARVKAAEAAKPKPATAASLNAAVAAGDTVTATTERGGEMQEATYGKDAEFIERKGVLYAKVGKTLDRPDSPAVVPANPAVGKAKAKATPKPEAKPQPKPKRGRGKADDGQGVSFMRERVTDVLDSFRDESDSSSRTSHLATELMWKYTVLDRAVKAASRKMNIDPEDAANELFQLAPGTVSRILQDFGNSEQKPFEEAVKALAKRLGISRERVFDKVQEHAFYKHAIDVMAWVKDRDAEEIARRAKRQQEMLTDMGVDVDPDAIYAEVLKSMTALGVDEGKASERLTEIEKEFAADPAWSNLSGQLRAMNRKTLEIRRESGQITETAYQELVKRYPSYVPVVVSIFDKSVTSETDEVTRPARRSLRAMRGIGESKRPIREYWAANWDLTKADRMSAAHAASLMPGDNAMFRLAMMEALKTASGENLLEVVDMQAMIGTEVRRLKMDLIKDRDASARKARERGEEPAAFEMPSDEVLTERAAQQVRTDLDMDVAGTSTQTPNVRRFKLERDMDMTDPRVYDDIELFARAGLTAAQTEANERARADGKPLPHTPVKTGTKAHERKMEQLQDKIRIMPKGTVMHYRIKDPMLAQAMLLNEPTWIERWRNEGGEVKRSLALGWLKLMAYQRFAFVTASPGFWKGELFRSPQQAQIMARVMSQEMRLPPGVQEEFLRNVDALNGAPVWPLVGVFGAFKALPGRKPWRSVRHVMRGGEPRNEYETLVRQAMEDGVMQGSLYSVADYESMQADLRDRVRRLTGASGTRMDRVRQKLSNVSDVMKTVTDGIDMITGGLDFVNRMVVYQAALMSGISRQQAAVMARDSTVDFSKKGTKTRGLSQMYLFFGPRMQGIHQLLRAFSTGDGAGAARIATSVSMRALMRMFLWAFVIKMMREFFWEDDDEPQTQPSQFASLQNMLIPMPLDSEKGQHIYLELNNPYGFGAIAKLADRIGEFLVGDATPLETIVGATGDFASELTPLAFNAAEPSSIIQAVTPTNLQFATDLVLNQDWKGSPVYPEGAKFGPGEQRRSQQYFAANTWRTSIWMADVIADLTRPIAQGLGFEGQRGVEISPNQIQYVFQRWMPGLVRQAVDGASWATGSRVTVDRLPIIGSFVTQTGGQGVLAGQWRDLGTIRANMKVDIKEGRESRRDLMERYGSVGRWLERGAYDRAANAIKKLQQARNQAERAGQPRERINRLDDRIEEIRERVLREYAMVRQRETGGGIDQMVGEIWRGRSR